MILITCAICMGQYRAHSGGHHRGGIYGGCCRTFASDTAGANHLTGPPDDRRCIDVENNEGWRRNQYGEWTDSKPMTEEAINRRRGAR